MNDAQPFELAVDLDMVCADESAGMWNFLVQFCNANPEAFKPMRTWEYHQAESFSDYFKSRQHFEEFIDFLVDECDYFEHLPPIEGASEALHTLDNAGVTITVLTSRMWLFGQHANVVSQTAKWLDANDIPYHNLCMYHQKQRMPADVFIDDSPAHITNIRAAGKYAIVFDQPYNQDVEGPRAHSWPEALELVIARAQSVGADLVPMKREGLGARVLKRTNHPVWGLGMISPDKAPPTFKEPAGTVDGNGLWTPGSDPNPSVPTHELVRELDI